MEVSKRTLVKVICDHVPAHEAELPEPATPSGIAARMKACGCHYTFEALEAQYLDVLGEAEPDAEPVAQPVPPYSDDTGVGVRVDTEVPKVEGFSVPGAWSVN